MIAEELRELSLARARGAREKKYCERAAGIIQAGFELENDTADGVHGMRLGDEPFTEPGVERRGFETLLLVHEIVGQTSGVREHAADVLHCHGTNVRFTL